MKLKAVLGDGCDPELVKALESASFVDQVKNRVLRGYLCMVDIGPAEFYVQKCDFACSNGAAMCEVRLTGVSVNTKRSTQNFLDALEALEDLYREVLSKHLPPSGETCQLFVSMMLDRPPFGMDTSLLERKPTIVCRLS